MIFLILDYPQHTYEEEMGPNRRLKKLYSYQSISDDGIGVFDGQKCCHHCSLWDETYNFVSFKSEKCDCAIYTSSSSSVSNSDITNVDNFSAGWCRPASGKKKRFVKNEEEDIITFKRHKRTATDLAIVRKIECVSWLDGSAAYWKYDYEIPSKCYSK